MRLVYTIEKERNIFQFSVQYCIIITLWCSTVLVYHIVIYSCIVQYCTVLYIALYTVFSGRWKYHERVPPWRTPSTRLPQCRTTLARAVVMTRNSTLNQTRDWGEVNHIGVDCWNTVYGIYGKITVLLLMQYFTAVLNICSPIQVFPCFKHTPLSTPLYVHNPFMRIQYRSTTKKIGQYRLQSRYPCILYCTNA